MRKANRFVAAVVALTTFSIHSQAATLYCTGTVEKMAYHSGNSNGLMVKLSSMNVPVFICNPDLEWAPPGAGYTTTPANCKALYATLLAARVSGNGLVGLHFDGNSVPASCSAWSNWSTVNVRYFEF